MTRYFLNGLPNPGYINFGKKFGEQHSFFLEDGRMFVPNYLVNSDFNEVIRICEFDMRDRHPNTFELLDNE